MMIQLFGMLHSMSKRGPSILSALAASFTAVLVNLKSVDFIADLDDPKIVNDEDAQRVCLDMVRGGNGRGGRVDDDGDALSELGV